MTFSLFFSFFYGWNLSLYDPESLILLSHFSSLLALDWNTKLWMENWPSYYWDSKWWGTDLFNWFWQWLSSSLFDGGEFSRDMGRWSWWPNFQFICGTHWNWSLEKWNLCDWSEKTSSVYFWAWTNTYIKLIPWFFILFITSQSFFFFILAKIALKKTCCNKIYLSESCFSLKNIV